MTDYEKGYEDFMDHVEFDTEATIEWQQGWTYALYNNALAIKYREFREKYLKEIE